MGGIPWAYGTALSAGLAVACGGNAVGSVREVPPGGAGGVSAAGAGGVSVAGAGGTTAAGGAGVGGTTATGDAGAARGLCDSDRAPPTFTVTPACAAFVPNLGPAFTMQLVERIVVPDGTTTTRWYEHRFRVAADSFQCGFDVVVRLDRLTFGAIGDRFDGSVWWIEGAGPLDVLTLVLESEGRLRLAVATPENTKLLLGLSPYDLEPAIETCGADSAATTALSKNAALVPCTPDPSDPSLETCETGAESFRMVPLFSPRLPDPAAIVGDSALLAPAD